MKRTGIETGFDDLTPGSGSTFTTSVMASQPWAAGFSPEIGTGREMGLLLAAGLTEVDLASVMEWTTVETGDGAKLSVWSRS